MASPSAVFFLHKLNDGFPYLRALISLEQFVSLLSVPESSVGQVQGAR